VRASAGVAKRDWLFDSANSAESAGEAEVGCRNSTGAYARVGARVYVARVRGARGEEKVMGDSI